MNSVVIILIGTPNIKKSRQAIKSLYSNGAAKNESRNSQYNIFDEPS